MGSIDGRLQTDIVLFDLLDQHTGVSQVAINPPPALLGVCCEFHDSFLLEIRCYVLALLNLHIDMH